MAARKVSWRSMCNAIVAFDLGRNTGWAMRKFFFNDKTLGRRERVKISSGSGDPFVVSEKIKDLKDCEQITLLFYYDQSFINAKTTEYLQKVRSLILESIIFKVKDIRIMLFSESAVFRSLTLSKEKLSSQRKKELTMFHCRRDGYKPETYDEADALQLLIYFMNNRNKKDA